MFGERMPRNGSTRQESAGQAMGKPVQPTLPMEDWTQEFKRNSRYVDIQDSFVHKPCGSIIHRDYRLTHSRICRMVRNVATTAQEDSSGDERSNDNPPF